MSYDNNRELIKKAQDGDKKALEKLVECNSALVSNIAKKFKNRGEDIQDVYQIGYIGLIKAIKKFDLKFDCQFSTYAFPMISGEIKRYFNDNGIIKVSRSKRILGLDLRYKIEDLRDKLNREPSFEEIADYTGNTLAEVTEALNAIQKPSSLNTVIYNNNSDNEICLADKLEDNSNLEERAILNLQIISLYECIDKLAYKEKNVMKLRMKEKTQNEVANILNISQVEVSRAEKRAKKKLKNMMRKHMHWCSV